MSEKKLICCYNNKMLKEVLFAKFYYSKNVFSLYRDYKEGSWEKIEVMAA